MTTPTACAKNTTTFYAQAAISFGLARFALLIGEGYLPLPGWTRAFVALDSRRPHRLRARRPQRVR